MLITIVRVLLLYFIVIFTLRLMGKKQLGELQPSELVTTIMVSNIATISLENPSVSVALGVVPILAIACFDVFMSAITMKNAKARRAVTGSPRVIIENGTLLQSELKELRYTLYDVIEAMRDNGIFDISSVQYAVVETTGKINFLQKADDSVVFPPAIVIKDGVIDDYEFLRMGYGMGWVEQTLCAHNVSVDGVFVFSVKSQSDFIIIKKEV